MIASIEDLNILSKVSGGGKHGRWLSQHKGITDVERPRIVREGPRSKGWGAELFPLWLLATEPRSPNGELGFFRGCPGHSVLPDVLARKRVIILAIRFSDCMEVFATLERVVKDSPVVDVPLSPRA